MLPDKDEQEVPFNFEEFEAMEIAILSDAHFGLRDVGQPCLWFNVHFKSGSALQVLRGDAIEQMLRSGHISDIADLKHMPCYVIVKDNTVKFVRLATDLLSRK